MLKKIALILITFVLMINCYMGVIYAAEAESNPEGNSETQSTEENNGGAELVENYSDIIEVKARVMKAGEVRKVTTGSVEDTVQEVTIEILEGEYKGKEYTTDYVLSYDIDGKILAYELKEGNNIVEIHVKAPAGNELIYTIHVAKEALITPSATPIPETEAPEWRFEVYEESGVFKLTGQYFYTIKEKDASVTIPAGYTKTSFIMNGVTIWAYTKTEDSDSDFLLLILENEAGETGLYRYDRVEKTIQRYLQEKNVISNTSKSLEEQEFLQDASDLMRYEQTISKLSLALAVAAGICLILLISVIALLIRRKNLDD